MHWPSKTSHCTALSNQIIKVLFVLHIMKNFLIRQRCCYSRRAQQVPESKGDKAVQPGINLRTRLNPKFGIWVKDVDGQLFDWDSWRLTRNRRYFEDRLDVDVRHKAKLKRLIATGCWFDNREKNSRSLCGTLERKKRNKKLEISYDAADSQRNWHFCNSNQFTANFRKWILNVRRNLIKALIVSNVKNTNIMQNYNYNLYLQ